MKTFLFCNVYFMFLPFGCFTKLSYLIFSSELWRWRKSEEESGGYSAAEKWVEFKLQIVHFSFQKLTLSFNFH